MTDVADPPIPATGSGDPSGTDPAASFRAELRRWLARELTDDVVRLGQRMPEGEDLDAYDRTVDVHISRLRALIEDDPKHPRRIITVRGAGYVFAKKQDGET